MMWKFSVWHNTRGIADQYYLVKGEKVLFQIPKWLGILLLQITKELYETIRKWVQIT